MTEPWMQIYRGMVMAMFLMAGVVLLRHAFRQRGMMIPLLLCALVVWPLFSGFLSDMVYVRAMHANTANPEREAPISASEIRLLIVVSTMRQLIQGILVLAAAIATVRTLKRLNEQGVVRKVPDDTQP